MSGIQDRPIHHLTATVERPNASPDVWNTPMRLRVVVLHPVPALLLQPTRPKWRGTTSADWRETIEAERASPRKLWQSVDQLLGCGCLPASSAISVDCFNQFFTDKVNLVRASTASALEPSYSAVRPGASLAAFSAVSVADVVTAIAGLPDKSSAADHSQCR